MKKSLAASVILILVWGSLIYANSFTVPFVFDDVDSIVENPDRRQLDLSPRNWFGTRAIVNLTFDLNYYYHQLDVGGYHAVNLVIHLASATAVFFLAYLLAKQSREVIVWEYKGWIFTSHWAAASIAGLIFVSHPLQTQGVTYVVQRLAAMTTLFYVISLVTYAMFRTVQGKSKYAWAVFSWICAAAAMNMKETAFTLPVALGLMEAVYFRHSWQVKYIAKRLLVLTPWFLTILIIPFYILEVDTVIDSYLNPAETEVEKNFSRDVFGRIPSAAAEKSDLDRYTYFITQFRVLATYWRLTVLPYGQHLDYHYPLSEGWGEGRVIGALVLHLAILAAAAYGWKKGAKLATFGILFFYLSLLPESSLVPITDVIFEHRMYLPMVGAVLLAAEGLLWAMAYVQQKKIPLKTAGITMVGITALITGPLGYLTWQRNEVWQSNVLIWRDSVKKSPEKGRPHNNLGLHLLAEGENDEAMAEFKKAVEVKPDYAEPRNNMGMILIQKGKPDEAEVELAEALRLKPDYSHALNNMGAIYMQRKDWPKAEEYFKKAVALDERYGGARDNLGMVLVNQGKLEEARDQLEMNINFNPDFVSSYNNLGVVYMRLGEVNKARKLLEQALEIDPTYAVARQNLDRINGVQPGAKGMKIFR